jgi:hypothetical protein
MISVENFHRQDDQRAFGGGLGGLAVSREGSVTESTFDGPVFDTNGRIGSERCEGSRHRFGALRKGIY